MFPERSALAPAMLHAVAAALAVASALSAEQDARSCEERDSLGAIDLPDDSREAGDIRALAPLYLANELEQAGVLETAELVAGLFASGAIDKPLGPGSQLIAEFWQARRQRLTAEERRHLFDQVFDAAGFYPLMRALCEALADPLDDPVRPADLHAGVTLRAAADALAQRLMPHASGMAVFAAQDILAALSQSARFLRDRLLLAAFGVRDIWGLVDAVGSARGQRIEQMRQHVELGRHGATVLAWLGSAASSDYAFDPSKPGGQQLVMEAQAWCALWRETRAEDTTASGAQPREAALSS
jgi:hypothetical protein